MNGLCSNTTEENEFNDTSRVSVENGSRHFNMCSSALDCNQTVVNGSSVNGSMCIHGNCYHATDSYITNDHLDLHAIEHALNSSSNRTNITDTEYLADGFNVFETAEAVLKTNGEEMEEVGSGEDEIKVQI